MNPTIHDMKAKVEELDVVENSDAELSDHLKNGEARIVRKVDYCLMPVFMMLMLLGFLDRGNIGFAASQGMIKDINLKGKQLNVAVSIFYVFYILAEIPSSLLAKRLQFNRVIPGVSLAWGVVCLGNGFVQNFAGLAVCRLLLGLFEGCLFPSMVLMMANWYRREELGYRVSWVYICIAMSSAFGGLIAYAILHMNGVAGYPGWRWLYIIEGAFTVVFSFACFWLIPKDYESAYFLNEDDKTIMRYRDEQTRAYSGGSGHYKLKDFMMAVKDIKTWFYAFNHMFCMTVVYGFSVFLPIILKTGFDFDTKQAQYLAVPVFLWGAIVLTVVGYVSDRYKKRYIAIVPVTPVGIAGYAILLAPVSSVPVGIRYFACFLITTSMFVCAAGNFAWLSCNTAPEGKRAASVGITLTLCNVGGIVSGQIYILDQAPQFRLGHAYSMGCILLSVVGWTMLRVIYKRREAGKADKRADGFEVQGEEMDDRDPGYKYQQ